MFELVGLLGPTEVVVDGRQVPITSGRLRTLVTSLALAHPHAITVEHVVDDVWPDRPPRQPVGAVHTLISRLRAVVGADAVASTPGGYRFRETDAPLSDLAAAEAVVAAAAVDDAASAHAVDALALWRGEPGAALPAGDLREQLSVRAARCHRSLQAIAWAHRLPTEPRAVAAEIAAHREQGFFLDEHLAALQMRALVAAGDANRALTEFALLRAALAERLGTDPGPELAAAHAEALRTPVPDQTSAHHTSTPAPPRNPLLAREDTLAELSRAVTESALVCVLGAGGIGKTRLVTEYVATRTGPDIYVDLAAARRSEDVAAAVAAALGADAVPDLAATRPSAESAAAALVRVAPRDALIILDACEEVAAVVAELTSEVSARRADLRMVVVSRVPLDSGGRLPIGAIRTVEVGPLPDDAATELFATRARAVAPGADLDVGRVAGLSRRLDGSPLALELAAAQLRHLSLADLGDRLGSGLSLLRVGGAGRHHSLADVVDASWELLPVPAREALAAVACFDGEIGLDDALGFDEVTVDRLGTLCAHGLLRFGEDAGGATRYRLTETIRDYVRGTTARTPELEARLHAQHTRWATTQIASALDDLRAGRVAAAARTLDRTSESVLSLLDHSDRPDVALLPAISWRWLRTGGHDNTLDLCRAAVAAAPESGPVTTAELAGLCCAVIHLAHLGAYRDAARGRIRLRHIRSIETDSATAGLDDLARALLTTSPRALPRTLTTAAHGREPLVVAAAELVRAEFAERSADPTLARRSALRAAIAAERVGHPWFSANARSRLGRISSQLGDHQTAIIHFARSAATFSSIGLREDACRVRVYQAVATVDTDPQAASALLTQCLQEAGAGDRSYVATAHMGRAQLLLADDPEAALAAVEEALAIAGPPADAHSIHMHAVAVALRHEAGEHAHARLAADELAATLGSRLGDREPLDLPSLGAVAAAIVKARGLAADHPYAAAARATRYRRDFAVIDLGEGIGEGPSMSRAQALALLLH